MPLFFCKWADRTSLLVDDEDEAHAREVATDVAEGETPSEVKRLPPRAFVAEVGLESEFDEDPDGDEDEDEEELWCVPLDHVDMMLAKLHQEDVAVRAEVIGEAVCGSEAEGENPDEVLVCTRSPNHPPPHRNGDLEW